MSPVKPEVMESATDVQREEKLKEFQLIHLEHRSKIIKNLCDYLYDKYNVTGDLCLSGFNRNVG